MHALAPRSIVLVVASLAVGSSVRVAPGQQPGEQPDRPAVGTRGMVSSAHRLATETGVDVLRRGGNAFDAAVAIAATLNVVEPYNSGIGGYGTILLHDAERRETWFLNPSAHIPRGVDSDVFRAPNPDHLDNRRSAKAISTPGAVPAWEAMWKRFGELEWPVLFERAIVHAERGFTIGPTAALLIDRGFGRFPAHARRFYSENGAPLRAGQTLVQRDLARSLQRIATDGAAVLRDGALARAIDRAARESGSFLRLDDLRDAQAEWREPIRIRYRDCVVWTASPPATSFPGLIRLGILNRFDVRALGPGSIGYLHRFAEATRHAWACRLRYAGDPDVATPPLDRLLSDAYCTDVAARIDPERKQPVELPQRDAEDGKHTTHFVVADAAGNIVSATLTLGQGFGSCVMPEGTGIWLNNSLQYCTFEPKGNPMDAHAGRRKLSGDMPTIVERDGRPWIAIGTPGGHAINQMVPQMIVNAVDFGMDIRAAIEAPRIACYSEDRLIVERAFPAPVRRALAAMGHDVVEVPRIGNAHALAIEYGEDGAPVRFLGAADPRGEGTALGHGRE